MEGLRQAIGDTVPGTMGKTVKDQDAIDEHVARACAAKLYSVEKCKRHTEASIQRMRELNGD